MSSIANDRKSSWRTPLIVLTAGCLIAIVAFGVRSSLGVFLEPMTAANGWDRQTYGLAMAWQNLLWGLAMPFAGALADRYGPRWVIIGGAVAYALGMYGMAVSTSGLALQLTGGVLAGVGVSFTSFSLVMATMAKAVGPERRSFALGLGAAAGSAGQVLFSPIALKFIEAFGWQPALFILAGFLGFVVVLSFVLPQDPSAKGEKDIGQTIGGALREAVVHRGYVLLAIGFFVCGFQIAFITIHFPAYVSDLGLPAHVGAYSISLIGLFNIIGTFAAGIAGQRWSKKNSLAVLYFVRSVAIVGLLLMPKTEINIYVFAATMGLFFLATVPLTNAVVAQIFGARYMTTLFGIVFVSHQIGSFLGVWLGGYIFDATGSYDTIWWWSVGFGVAAAVLHVLIDERPLARLSQQMQPAE